MDRTNLILISVDDHVVEPPDMFEQHLPRSYRDLDEAPRIVRTEAGDDVWAYDGRLFPNIGLNAVAGRHRADYGVDPTSYDEMRRGCWDIDSRIDDMNANGVLGSMCFPSFPGFAVRYSREANDKDLALACVKAYNDWHLESWCGPFPGRFIPLGLVPFWDIDLMIAETARLAERGFHSISFSENPSKLGSTESPHGLLGPLLGCVPRPRHFPALHIGSSSSIVVTSLTHRLTSRRPCSQ